MASWAAVLALTGFHYSAVEQRMMFAARSGRFFWSTGYGYGACTLTRESDAFEIAFEVLGGKVSLQEFRLADFGYHQWDAVQRLETGATAKFRVARVA
jgi:hypothetical protein